MDKWMTAVWMIANCKNGISSYEIARALGITQKSAWFMLHRIRLAMHNKDFVKLGGKGSEVEVHETFIGGASRFMHRRRRHKYTVSRRGLGDKAAVFGMLELGGELHASVIPTRRKHDVQGGIRSHVRAHSAIYSDPLLSYQALAHHDFAHQVIDHAERYVDGQVHTNGLENFWSLLKRGLKGTYVSVEPFHLFRYVDEQVFRFNNRATKEQFVSDLARFFSRDASCHKPSNHLSRTHWQGHRYRTSSLGRDAAWEKPLNPCLFSVSSLSSLQV